MTRARVIVALLMGVGLTAFLTARPDRSARAADAEPAVGANTEEIAIGRWKDNSSRHWRYMVTQR